MIIAVNCRLLQKGRLEGIGWFTYENLKRITRDHPEHQFVFIFDRHFDPEFLFADNVRGVVLGPPTRHPVLWYFWLEWRIPALLRKIKADLFFSPDGYLSLRSRIPQIPVIHDINFAHRPEDLPFWTRHYYNFFFPRFARKAQRICTVSKYSKKDIHSTYKIPKPLIHVVYNGANTNFTPLSAAEKQAAKARFTNGEDYFIYIGSIHPRKNLENLIAAFDRFTSATKSPVKLLIVGTNMWNKGPGQKNQTSNLIFAGHLESDDLKLALGGALAMTFVPWFEGFGIPVLEAMQSGVPVLTSTETSLPEVGGDAVLYAQPGNVEEIATQMAHLATKPELRNHLIEKGLNQATTFSWDKTSKKVWKCLDTVITSQLQNKDGA